jgi:CHAD domain-containing protein
VRQEIQLAFELQINEPIGCGVKRIVAEQLDDALSDLSVADARKPDNTVHSIRKRFKRVRALLRIVRSGIDESLFAVENASFRDAGATLSQVRDATVLVQTLDTLKDMSDAEAFALARKRLLARRRAVKKRMLEGGNGLQAVAEVIEAARVRAQSWPLEGTEWAVLQSGIHTAYRKARQSYKFVRQNHHSEMFHEWRKRVKDLWHQMELLEPLWPKVLKPLADEFHALADTLGQQHDLAVLKEVLEAEALARAQPPSRVIEAVELRNVELEREAKRQGARLFAEKPKAFIRRVGKYFEAARATDAPVETAVMEQHIQACETVRPALALRSIA